MTIHSSSNGQLLVNTCGRTLQVDIRCARSLPELTKNLQLQLQMEGQAFDFFDVNGTTLSSDAQVADAITKGHVPLYAALTDQAIHFIENRREELAQMQWKLVRDQMTAASGKMAALQRQVTEMQKDFEQFKQESTSVIDRVHKEALRAVESERDVAQCEVRQLSERVSAVAQLLAGERQKRDVAISGMEKMIDVTRK